jgi:hypothetical protein
MSLFAWAFQHDRKIDLLSCRKNFAVRLFLYCYFHLSVKLFFSFIAITIRSNALITKEDYYLQDVAITQHYSYNN